MNKTEYLKYAITNRLYSKLKWFYLFFTLLKYDNIDENEYIRLNNGIIEVNVNDEWVELKDVKDNEAIYKFIDKITIDNTWIVNVNNEIDTTIGRLIANCILLTDNFNNKIQYINKPFTIKNAEDIIGPLLRTNVITIEEYLNFTYAVSFITGLSNITTMSATLKSVLPTPGLDKKKKELIKDFDNKYGKDWSKNRTRVQELIDELKKFDNEWIKDDPSYGKYMSGKVTNNSRPKMFISFGGEAGFDSKSGYVDFVANSLLEQYPDLPEQLAAMYNSSRSGSYDRGHETQKGGSAAKDIIRSTSGVKIIMGDCGSNKGYKLLVTKNNHKSLFGRYLVNGKLIEDTESLIGTTITIRSPLYCLSNGDNYCKICAGEIAATTPTGVSLKLLSVSSALLKISLKAMHNTQVSLHKFNILENLK